MSNETSRYSPPRVSSMERSLETLSLTSIVNGQFRYDYSCVILEGNVLTVCASLVARSGASRTINSVLLNTHNVKSAIFYSTIENL